MSYKASTFLFYSFHICIIFQYFIFLPTKGDFAVEIFWVIGKSSILFPPNIPPDLGLLKFQDKWEIEPILNFLPLKDPERLFMLKMIYIKIHTLAFSFVCYIVSHILIFSLSPLWTTNA